MKNKTLGYYIIASAIIWGAIIIGCSVKLKGTECYQSISKLMYLGASAHLLFIWGPMGSQIKKNNQK